MSTGAMQSLRRKFRLESIFPLWDFIIQVLRGGPGLRTLDRPWHSLSTSSQNHPDKHNQRSQDVTRRDGILRRSEPAEVREHQTAENLTGQHNQRKPSCAD